VASGCAPALWQSMLMSSPFPLLYTVCSAMESTDRSWNQRCWMSNLEAGKVGRGGTQRSVKMVRETTA
jgi:hypothetical protein